MIGDHAIMRQQLHQLIQVSNLPNVTIQVLPSTAGTIISITGGIVILKFFGSDEPDIVHIGHTRGDLYLESPEETQEHRQMFERLQQLALTAEDSALFLLSLLKELNQHEALASGPQDESR